jgi:peroxiredoxin
LGTVAPDFELPDATGKKRNLASLLEGQDQILLVFLSPHCKPCQAVAASLPKWVREHERLPEIIIVSRGSTDDNLEKLKDTDPSRVLLQQNLETAAAYDCTSTPAAVLVGSDRLIRSQSAVGSVAIQQLLATCAKTQPATN